MDTLCISPRGDRVEEGHSDRERERESDMGGGLMGKWKAGEVQRKGEKRASKERHCQTKFLHCAGQRIHS